MRQTGAASAWHRVSGTPRGCQQQQGEHGNPATAHPHRSRAVSCLQPTAEELEAAKEELVQEIVAKVLEVCASQMFPRIFPSLQGQRWDGYSKGTGVQ